MALKQLLLVASLFTPTLVVGAGATATGQTSAPAGADGSSAEVEIGKRLYLEGIRENATTLEGTRAGGTKVTGKQAACVMCHRRSGLGGVEGQSIIPPISGRALFGEGEPVLVQEDRRFNTTLSEQHAPYDAKSFAAAIRKGKHVSGRILSELMPRYDLTDREIKALSAYLRTLSVTQSPGVDGKVIHMATVIAPGVSEERRKVFLGTLNAMLNQYNVAMGSKQNQHVPTLQRKLRTRRLWSLQVWELSGPSDTWAAQLDQRQRENPVFAVLSGLGQGEWQPVHDFCERSKVACWFPSLDQAPQDAERSYYGVYFSKGTPLEASVIAQRLRVIKPGRVVQLAGPEAAAQAAQKTLREALAGTGTEIVDRNWDAGHLAEIKASLGELSPRDAVVLWLRPADLAQLAGLSPPSASVFVSATLAGAPTRLPTSWLQSAWLADGLERPDLRQANLHRLRGWLNYRKLDLADEKLQSEVYFAVNSLAWMLAEMLNNLHTDYLIERAESTLSMRESMQVQEEINSMMMGGGGRGARPDQIPGAPAPAAPTNSVKAVDFQQLMKRQGTTVYPRLSLGPDQRYASKGAFLIRFDPKDGSTAQSKDAEWIVP